MWPFKKKPQLTTEQADRCRRKCGLAAGTLHHCLAANAANPGICDSLEVQVVHCHAEVACPELAAQHQQCFTRVVNSKGREPYSACSKEVEAMKKCLQQYQLYPINPPPAPSSGSGSSSSGGSPPPRRKAAAA